jgi:hypothetical protein
LIIISQTHVVTLVDVQKRSTFEFRVLVRVGPVDSYRNADRRPTLVRHLVIHLSQQGHRRQIKLVLNIDVNVSKNIDSILFDCLIHM